MSLIFDKFPSTQAAERFKTDVKERFGLGGDVYASQEESNQYDPFPFELIPPIVLIDRPLDEDAELERGVASAVSAFGGQFAGT